MVKVTLIHASWCHVCPAARKFWNDLRSERDFDYEEVDYDTPEGAELSEKYSIMSVPTTIIDGEIAFIGVPGKEEALSKIS
ncbi:thioredoxin family protein [Methanococcoides orientis]|uniref:glutaredoxin family protein n=1 Tax=Methanococcoides orientis TaxID=2822137 RepID=UPI001E603CFD|nr:thioredoxin family protein [Methanococcoides orientis]UGV41043.1 thioredoxin family protein [Methanococcoides orientis]